MLGVSELVDTCQQDNPGSTNTLHLILSTDSDLRWQSRSYTELSVTFSNMFGHVCMCLDSFGCVRMHSHTFVRVSIKEFYDPDFVLPESSFG